MNTPTQRVKDEWSQCLIAVRDRKDQACYIRLFRHFAPRAKSLLMKGGASATEAEEAVQEAMVQVWRKAHLFEPTIATASTWIFTIVRNKRIDLIRKERRPVPEELDWGPEEVSDPADQAAMAQEQKQLHQAISKLPERQRDVVEKAYLGELSHSEIAEATGLPLGTIKSRIRLGLERLRHELGGT